jgi:hypothetical protein
MFALMPEEDHFGKIMAPDGMLKAKGAGILHPTASNSNKNGPYRAKKAMAGIVR